MTGWRERERGQSKKQKKCRNAVIPALTQPSPHPPSTHFRCLSLPLERMENSSRLPMQSASIAIEHKIFYMIMCGSKREKRETKKNETRTTTARIASGRYFFFCSCESWNIWNSFSFTRSHFAIKRWNFVHAHTILRLPPSLLLRCMSILLLYRCTSG